MDRIAEEISYCFTYEEGNTCCGACGRKLRQVCIWCPNYQKQEKRQEEKNEKGN